MAPRKVDHEEVLRMLQRGFSNGEIRDALDGVVTEWSIRALAREFVARGELEPKTRREASIGHSLRTYVHHQAVLHRAFEADRRGESMVGHLYRMPVTLPLLSIQELQQ